MSYTLEPYHTPASRHTCPNCGSPRQFARYINSETREYLADHVGRCNREQNCSYHYTPKQYFHDHPENSISCQAERSRSPVTISVVKAQIPKSSNPQINTLSNCHINKLSHSFPNPQINTLSHCHINKLSHSFPNPQINPLSHCHIATSSHSLIPDTIFQNSLSNYKHNHFITFLKSIFDPSTVTKLVNSYLIGTSKNWPGSTVFWQIDTHGNIRDGKIMLYDPSIGRRIKQPYNHITWAHSALKLKEYNLQQCFFGEHLLNLHPTLPVSIVESEKTAIIASVYFPQFVWIATGGKHGCKWSSPTVSSVLKGRHITLWPDISAYDDWQLKATELAKSGLRVTLSNLLEQVATDSEREAGLDIADYLIRFKPYQFSEQNLCIPESSQLTNCHIAESSHNQINKLSHRQIAASSHSHIPTFPNSHILTLINCRIVKLPNCQIPLTANSLLKNKTGIFAPSKSFSTQLSYLNLPSASINAPSSSTFQNSSPVTSQFFIGTMATPFSFLILIG